MGFEQFLKTYVPVIEILNYDDRDALLIEKLEQILNETFGEKIFTVICLKLQAEDRLHKVFVGYDKDENPFEYEYVFKLAIETIGKMAKIGE